MYHSSISVVAFHCGPGSVQGRKSQEANPEMSRAWTLPTLITRHGHQIPLDSSHGPACSMALTCSCHTLAVCRTSNKLQQLLQQLDRWAVPTGLFACQYARCISCIYLSQHAASTNPLTHHLTFVVWLQSSTLWFLERSLVISVLLWQKLPSDKSKTTH